jgi:hypothetical protein
MRLYEGAPAIPVVHGYKRIAVTVALMLAGWVTIAWVTFLALELYQLVRYLLDD